MFPRIRDITDGTGACLRVSVEAHPSGALVTIQHQDLFGRPRALLDSYGCEVLWGYIMSARLALPYGLADERIGGGFPSRLHLCLEPHAQLVITQAELERPFVIPVTFWDRLYAELCLIMAHARELSRCADARVH